jgi:Coenzyme PQQ synthesis protein D (PqqD)
MLARLLVGARGVTSRCGLRKGVTEMGWLARNPDVECTELEDGAVLLNMETRLYYSLNQVGLELWDAIDAADGPEQVASRVAGAFRVDDQTALDAVSRFVPALERERLVVPSTERGVATTREPESQDGQRTFEEPQLIKHDEPLHEAVAAPFDAQLPLAE